MRRLLVAIVFLNAPLAGASSDPDVDRVSDAIEDATNALRKTRELAPLATVPALEKAAQDFADFMARTDKYGHRADGRTPSQRAAAAGYDYCLVAENIASQYRSGGFASHELARALSDGWEGSASHRKNMLDPDATETGVAVARSKRTGTYYAVQLVARPRSAMAQFAIANLAGVAVSYRIDGEPATIKPQKTRKLGRCRPPEIVVLGTGKDRGGRETFHPRNGDRILITSDAAGIVGATLVPARAAR